MVDITLARDQVWPAAADDDPRAALVASCTIRLDSEAIVDGDVDEEADARLAKYADADRVDVDA